MRINKFAKAIATCAVASACVFGAVALTGCGSNDSGELTSDTGLTGGVAATVNGEEVSEDKVTRAINNLRLSYNYTDQDEWKDFLKQANQTPESLRYSILGTYVNELLVRQCADQLGVSVSDEEVDEKVQSMASQYSTEEAWENALKGAGYVDGIQEYKEAITYAMLQEKINGIYAEEAEKDMKDNKNVLSAVNESISQYDGAKKTSMVLFSSDEEILAKSTRKKIADGEMTIEEAAKEYSISSSAKEDSGDMGWNVLNQYDDEYTGILSDLEKKGAVSKATETENGWVVVQLKEIYKAPKKVSKLSSVPEEFVTEIKSNAVESKTSDKFDDWVDGLKGEQDVVVNPMPDNLPYWVDMSGDYTEDEMKKINDEAYEDVVGEVAAEEAEDSAVEGDSNESSDASGDQAGEGSEAESSDNGEAADEGSGESEGESNEEADAQADSADSGE